MSEARAAQVKWDLPSDTEESMIRFLPVMQTDIFLRYKEQILIIDTKYYGHTMQMQYDKATLHSGNMYQIFTYVKNQDVKNTGNVSGMLLEVFQYKFLIKSMNMLIRKRHHLIITFVCSLNHSIQYKITNIYKHLIILIVALIYQTVPSYI